MTDKDICQIVESDDIDNMLEFGLTSEQKQVAIEHAIKRNKLNILSALLEDDFTYPNQEKFLFLAIQKQNKKALQLLCGSQRKWHGDTIKEAYQFAWQKKFWDIIHSLYFLTGQWFDRKKN